MYKVRVEKAAEKVLEKIDEPFYSKIKAAILNLRDNPRPQGYKKLKGQGGYRVRVGNYRIIYNIFDEVLLVEVINLGNRKDIYG